MNIQTRLQKGTQRRYDWNKMMLEFEERLEKAVPPDMKDFVGIIDAKGHCPDCKEKKVLFLDRKSKQSFCADCRPATGYEFTAIEYDEMWQLARELLYYSNEVIQELKYPDVDFSGITPAKMKSYLLSRGWSMKPFKNENLWKFTHTLTRGEKSIELTAMVPAHTGFDDYKQAAEIVIEVVSTLEERSPYEVFLNIQSS